jgi:tungstate transport system ATP-binding protein
MSPTDGAPGAHSRDDLPADAWPAAASGRNEVLLELHRASVHLGGRTVLDGVDLKIRAGERVALVGANGSGKTSLLRLLHGQLDAHLMPGGRRVLHADGQGQAPRQAMVFQRPFLLRLSVRHNLHLALWLARVPRAHRQARALAALRRVGLADAVDRPARVLSAGQQQRLALARAWAVQPQLLFLDEPTASLDPHAKREVEALIAEFAAEGMTVVMSSHNLGQVKRLASRVLHLADGRLTADRPASAFFNDPLPPEAAAFVLGELP